MNAFSEDTIAAISTPVAAGGIGMVRISGPQALEVADRVFRSVSGKQVQQTEGYRGLYGRVHDGQGEIDEAVVFVYRAPKSYTGENVAEICCHGGVYLVQRTLRACIAAGARPAQAGEFTRRAFLNGKMSLTQAEAVMDLIASQGQQSAQAALQAKDGAVFSKIHQVIDRMLSISSALAAWVDYPDEDIDEVSDDNLRAGVEEICRRLHDILRGYDNGKILREGVSTVIVGRPNVGKSTLMNLLSGQEKSIVTQIPGTTRDIVEDTIRLGDIVLNLADTAGLRDTDDPVEKVGVELARKRLDTSYLVLAVFDSSQALEKEDWELMDALEKVPAIAIVNKNDLPTRMDVEAIQKRFEKTVSLSAATGEGLAALEQALSEILDTKDFHPQEGVLFTQRQRMDAQTALDSLREGEQALVLGLTLDAVTVCVEDALHALAALTGEQVSEEIVDRVFEEFCVGK